MLEKMNEFFNNRLNGYEEHQLNSISCAREFYAFTAECLPANGNADILDLGCGTGLELGCYFKLNPSAKVTGIDLAEDMLKALKERFADKSVTLIYGSYFDIPLEKERYDAAVSVESLHHFTKSEKIPLYKKVFQSLKSGGYFILTDYFAPTEERENFFRQELLRLKAVEGIDENDKELYHYDTPLTEENEIKALREAGFSDVTVLRKWGATCTIKANKL